MPKNRMDGWSLGKGWNRGDGWEETLEGQRRGEWMVESRDKFYFYLAERL
jgi:hypothetical protein